MLYIKMYLNCFFSKDQFQVKTGVWLLFNQVIKKNVNLFPNYNLKNQHNSIDVHKTFSTIEKSIRKQALLREMTPLFPLCDVHKSLKTLKDTLKDKTVV